MVNAPETAPHILMLAAERLEHLALRLHVRNERTRSRRSGPA